MFRKSVFTIKALVVLICLAGWSASPAAAGLLDFHEVAWTGVKNIPDNNTTGTKVELVVGADPTIGKNIIEQLVVDIIIHHTWQGHLTLILEHEPSGTTQVLMDKPGSGVFFALTGYSANNLGNIHTGLIFTFSDDAATPYDVPHVARPGLNNVSGLWKPENPLSAFKDLNSRGKWTLRVVDHFEGEVGQIKHFGLRILHVPEPTTLALLGLGGLLIARRRTSR
jgi:subtilisin-like proprotein convertase family protein